jgi:hypothetical protein
MASAPVWLSRETKKIAMRAVEMSERCTLVTQYWRTNDAGCLMSVCLSRRACIAVWRVCQRTALSYDDC